MPSKIVQYLCAVLLFIALLPSPILACTFHNINFGSLFEATYPGSLEVAAATARARSEGKLPRTELESGNLGFFKASRLLERLGVRLAGAPEAAKVDFFLVLAGQQLWTYYRVKSNSNQKVYAVHVHTAPPLHAVPVVLTSYFAVEALHHGTITIQSALDDGLVQIRGDRRHLVASALKEGLSTK